MKAIQLLVALSAALVATSSAANLRRAQAADQMAMGTQATLSTVPEGAMAMDGGMADDMDGDMMEEGNMAPMLAGSMAANAGAGAATTNRNIPVLDPNFGMESGMMNNNNGMMMNNNNGMMMENNNGMMNNNNGMTPGNMPMLNPSLGGNDGMMMPNNNGMMMPGVDAQQVMALADNMAAWPEWMQSWWEMMDGQQAPAMLAEDAMDEEQAMN